MSLLPNINSLSGLAAHAARVEELLYGIKPIDRQTFDSLQDHLNALQVNCPNHDGVVKARVRWYELMLDNFEKEVVAPLEGGAEIDIGKLFWGTHNDPSILGGPQTMEHFVRRSYLKGEFPRLYASFLLLYDRMAEVQSLSEEHRKYFAETAQRYRDKLLEGRL